MAHPKRECECYPNPCGYFDVSDDAEELSEDEEDRELGEEDTGGPELNCRERSLEGGETIAIRTHILSCAQVGDWELLKARGTTHLPYSFDKPKTMRQSCLFSVPSHCCD